MSKCISHHGEYSDCVPDQNFICERCLVLDEAAVLAVLGQLRAELARQKAGREIEQTMLRNALPQLAALERVRALHVIEEAVTARPWCASDKMLWPCPTTRALKEPTP